ncbi:MAG: hypothetical protein RLZZ437_3507 [Pseudomonadota bacterium]|jgi:hypothetical protein
MPISARALCAALLCAGVAQADTPLSAIDWLSQSVQVPVVTAGSNASPKPVVPADEKPVVEGALPEDVTVSVLGGPDPDAVGLLPPQVTGLPLNLWGMGLTSEIAASVTVERADALPALRQLLVTLLLAEATPPIDSTGNGQLLLSRVDKLLALGALDQAQALLAAADPTEPALFQRAFDVALLTGTEDNQCKVLLETPALSPTFPARIFCIARSGDWAAAALSLRTGQTLGDISPEEEVLLARFLDPDLFEGEPAPPRPARITPLTWRLFEAIGEPLSTANLPIAFAHADLSEQSGLKAQIEAAERLASAGAIAPNLLLGLYTKDDPAASGGVWDRVSAFQRFDAALAARDVARIAESLPTVWRAMEERQLEVAFATLYAERLIALNLDGPAGALAFEIGLLSPLYERFAAARQTTDKRELFLRGLALGKLDGLSLPDSMARAIAPAFTGQDVAEESASLLEQGRLGEAILLAIDQITRGVTGELRGVTDGLALLRRVGLESVARRAALELVLLERRG